MKKNKMMRVASFVLVAVLLSTSVISGTFAKYTTQDGASDVARVAKWGVELQVVGNLYGDTYKDTIVKEDDAGLTVQSVDKTADLVAPGTKNDEGFTFSLKGKPEVAGTITTTMKIQNVFLKAGTYGLMIPVDSGLITEANYDEFSDLYYKDGSNYVKATAWATGREWYTLEDYVVVSDDYYPVVYKLAGSTTATGADTADSLKVAADAIAEKLGLTAGAAAADTSITYTSATPMAFVANTDLATVIKLDGETLTWAWAYEGSGAGDAAAENDKADTILGLVKNTTEGTVVKMSGSDYVAVVEYTDFCVNTQFSLDITVTQVD